MTKHAASWWVSSSVAATALLRPHWKSRRPQDSLGLRSPVRNPCIPRRLRIGAIGTVDHLIPPYDSGVVAHGPSQVPLHLDRFTEAPVVAQKSVDDCVTETSLRPLVPGWFCVLFSPLFARCQIFHCVITPLSSKVKKWWLRNLCMAPATDLR